MSAHHQVSNGAPFPNAVFDVVGIAAPAGGLNAITKLLAALPPDFPAAIVIVQHLDPRHRSLMAEILNRHSALPVKESAAGDWLTGGAVFVAPLKQHLLVNQDQNRELELAHFALEAERQRYLELIDLSPDGYLITSNEGVVQEANRAASNLLGLSPQFLAGKPLLVFIAPEDRRDFNFQLRRLGQHHSPRNLRRGSRPGRESFFLPGLPLTRRVTLREI
jgi:PAS domain S-box-containing protein